ncbi:MAG: FadR/GntR family transcriptional regulator [Blastocatellia bacterium]
MKEGKKRMDVAAQQVIIQVREMIESGALRVGDRLLSEREFAKQIGISRPSLRAGLRALIGLGVLESHHGKGTYVSAGPPMLASEQLTMLAALHGFTLDEIFEARRELEVMLAGLAAERITDEQLIAISEEVASMFATVDRPEAFLEHDIRFHRSVSSAAQSPILATLVEMVSAMHYKERKAANQTTQSLRESAEAHQRIYRAIRNHDAAEARRLMAEHVRRAQRIHEQELAMPARRPDADAIPRRRQRKVIAAR